MRAGYWGDGRRVGVGFVGVGFVERRSVGAGSVGRSGPGSCSGEAVVVRGGGCGW